MRMIVILVALVIVGLLVARQLQAPTTPATTGVEATSGQPAPPSVPTRPQDVPQFKQDINNYMQQAGENQAQQIDQATQQ